MNTWRLVVWTQQGDCTCEFMTAYTRFANPSGVASCMEDVGRKPQPELESIESSN